MTTWRRVAAPQHGGYSPMATPSTSATSAGEQGVALAAEAVGELALPAAVTQCAFHPGVGSVDGPRRSFRSRPTEGVAPRTRRARASEMMASTTSGAHVGEKDDVGEGLGSERQVPAVSSATSTLAVSPAMTTMT